jgi:P4 family phage/plasmid primase-like protien
LRTRDVPGPLPVDRSPERGAPVLSHSTSGETSSGRTATPYADAARVYRELGWRGVLPVDLGGRPGHVPSGFTGHAGADPDDDQVARWVDTHADHNLGLRVPDDPDVAVLGLDVDAYDGKQGAETVAYVAEQLDAGDLPPTWTSTARGPDQPSRIYLYRVPAGRRWRSDLGRGSGVEVVQRGHRWARVWPSVNHRLLARGGDVTYRWYRPDGTESDRPPRPDELTELSPSWVDVLRDDSNVALPGRDRNDGDHRHDDVPVVDLDGQPVDPDLVLDRGLPVGSQQTELFRYMCSLRARGARRSEMLVLGMVALQRLVNDPEREPWTANDVTSLVDRVRREYAPGSATQLTPAMQAFAERFRSGVASVDEPAPRDEAATDLGNSLRFARLMRERARYAEDVGRWYVWDGRRWEPDPQSLRVVDLTKHVIDDVRRQAFVDHDHRDAWLRWANDSESLNRRRAAVNGAASEPVMLTTSEVFDRDPQLLVVRNGTVDLRTGELRDSDPNDLCSHLADVDFDVESSYERWSAHVAFVCNGDSELARYLARAVGYSLTGDVGARAFFFLEGKGSNGKNAFIEPIMQVMGSYAQTASPALLTGSEGDHPAVLADLLGARLVFVDETRKEKPLNVERIKALTGSRLIKAAFKHKNYFDFEARFKLWIAGNGRPKLNDESDGVWRRLHRVVCHGKVDPARRVDRYGDVLYREESSGILRWALEGLADWRTRGGLDVPQSVTTAVEEYRHDENYVQQFAEEFIQVTGDRAHRVTVDELYTRYQFWCGDVGLRGPDVKNRVHFSRSLGALDDLDEEHGVRRGEWKSEGTKVRGFEGLRWRPREE